MSRKGGAVGASQPAGEQGGGWWQPLSSLHLSEEREGRGRRGGSLPAPRSPSTTTRLSKEAYNNWGRTRVGNRNGCKEWECNRCVLHCSLFSGRSLADCAINTARPELVQVKSGVCWGVLWREGCRATGPRDEGRSTPKLPTLDHRRGTPPPRGRPLGRCLPTLEQLHPHPHCAGARRGFHPPWSTSQPGG